MSSLPHKILKQYCDWCGAPESWPWGVPYLQGETPALAHVCSSCKRRSDYTIEGYAASHDSLNDHLPPVVEPLTEEDFTGLFKAARGLFDRGIEAEEIIIPTLAFAAERGRGSERHRRAGERLAKAWQAPEAQREEVVRFEAAFKRLKPLEMFEDTLIVQNRAVWGDFSLGMRDGGLTGTEPAFLVILGINLRQKLAASEQVAECYKEVLIAEGVGFSSWKAVDSSYYYYQTSMNLQIMSNRIPNAQLQSASPLPLHPAYLHYHLDCLINSLNMPHPELVRRHYESLLTTRKMSQEGLASHALGRSAGGEPKAHNLIPACVAFYLKHYAKIEGRKEIHRILNELVLCDTCKTLNEYGFSSPETTQLWRDVKSLSPRLRAEAHA